MDDASGSQTRSAGAFPRYLSSLLEVGTTTGLDDGQLLDLFLASRDSSAEVAFAAILERHGGMVRRVCREVLEDSHDADDAFQATFLILARSAGGIRIRRSLGPWLHGVALRVARRTRSDAARRRRHERRHGEMAQPSATPDGSSPVDPEVGRALHEEIGRLGEKLRSPVVLCYLEGLTHEMAAEQIGCPVGTVRSRLASARDRLKGRLMRRGIAPSLLPASLAKLGDVAITSAPTVPISSSLVETTLRAALRIGAGDPSLGGVVSASVAALVEEGLRAMFWTKMKLLAITTLSMGVITTGAGVAAYSYRFADGAQQERTAQTAPPALKKAEPTSPNSILGETKKAPVGFVLPKEVQEQRTRGDLERIRALIKEFEFQRESQRKSFFEAKTQQEIDKLSEQLRLNTARLTVPMVTGALFDISERNPRTRAAEEALVWIIRNNVSGSIVEKAKAVLARDFAASGKMEGLLDATSFTRLVMVPWGSPANEALLRAVAVHNSDPKNRGLATYFLAAFLESQANYVSMTKLYGDDPIRHRFAPINVEGWGADFMERLEKKDPAVLNREAEDLFNQVITRPEYSAIPSEADGRLLLGSPTTLGELAKIRLDEIRRLGIGKPAPEIVGVDLDGKPMKLSEYRGEVVVIYFCARSLLENAKAYGPQHLTVMVRDAANRYREEGLVVLGVPVPERRLSPEPKKYDKDWNPKFLGYEPLNREQFKKAIEVAKLPFRFWWDQGEPKDQPGPIARDWDASAPTTVIIDHRGIIRARGPIEPAVKPLLQERKKDLGR